MSAFVCVREGGREQVDNLMVIKQRILYFSWFTGWRLGNREQNFGLFLADVFLNFYLLLSKFIKLFLSDKSSKVFWG